jgi:hypothetical protein
MDREQLLDALADNVEERREQMVREWKSDRALKAVLHRYDHIFDDAPVRRRVAAR